MFSDNKIAESFKLGKTESGYFINYGLAPFFKTNLIKSIKDSPFFAASFGESLNRIYQDEQMDFQICYCRGRNNGWSPVMSGRILSMTRYFYKLDTFVWSFFCNQ